MFDPGPAGSIGDVSWVIDARKSGKLPLLIVQGVLMTDLARAADVVLPGACSFEKDGAYVNQQGQLQAAARALDRAGRRAGRLADLRQPRDGARRDARLHDRARRCAPTWRARWPATPTYAGLAAARVRPAGGGEELAAGV